MRFQQEGFRQHNCLDQIFTIGMEGKEDAH